MSTRIALIGPGAIGCTLVAHLLARPDSEVEVSILARTPFPTLTVELPDGTRLESTPSFLPATPPPPEPPLDWVFVATKAYDSASVAPALASLVSVGTQVAILQNGVEHRERFRDVVPAAQLLPVMVDLPAERRAPGEVCQRGPGQLRVPADASGRAFVELFAETSIDAATADDFTTVVWRKLALNAPGAVNALLLQPNRLVEQPAVAELMRGIILEVIAVACAEGARLEPSLADEVLESMRRAAPDGVNSLLADRLASRAMETDARNGAVVRAGRRHGISTPLNQMAVTLLDALAPPR